MQSRRAEVHEVARPGHRAPRSRRASASASFTSRAARRPRGPPRATARAGPRRFFVGLVALERVRAEERALGERARRAGDVAVAAVGERERERARARLRRRARRPCRPPSRSGSKPSRGERRGARARGPEADERARARAGIRPRVGERELLARLPLEPLRAARRRERARRRARRRAPSRAAPPPRSVLLEDRQRERVRRDLQRRRAPVAFTEIPFLVAPSGLLLESVAAASVSDGAGRAASARLPARAAGTRRAQAARRLDAAGRRGRLGRAAGRRRPRPEEAPRLALRAPRPRRSAGQRGGIAKLAEPLRGGAADVAVGVVEQRAVGRGPVDLLLGAEVAQERERAEPLRPAPAASRRAGRAGTRPRRASRSRSRARDRRALRSRARSAARSASAAASSGPRGARRRGRRRRRGHLPRDAVQGPRAQQEQRAIVRAAARAPRRAPRARRSARPAARCSRASAAGRPRVRGDRERDEEGQRGGGGDRAGPAGPRAEEPGPRARGSARARAPRRAPESRGARRPGRRGPRARPPPGRATSDAASGRASAGAARSPGAGVYANGAPATASRRRGRRAGRQHEAVPSAAARSSRSARRGRVARRAGSFAQARATAATSPG